LNLPSVLTELKHCHKSLLGNFHRTHLAHSFFTFLLFLQKLLLSCDITTVTLGQDVLADCLDRLPGNDLAADGRLDWNLKEMSGNLPLQSLAHAAASLIGRGGMNDEGEGIHRFPIDQDIQFDQIGPLITLEFIIKGSIASGSGFQCIKEIIDDLIEGQLIFEQSAGLFHIFHGNIGAPPLLAEGHDGTHIVFGDHNLRSHHRLLHILDAGGVRQIGGIGQVETGSISQMNLINNTGGGGDQVQPILPLQSLLDDLQMEQAQKTAPEPRSQAHTGGLHH